MVIIIIIIIKHSLLNKGYTYIIYNVFEKVTCEYIYIYIYIY